METKEQKALRLAWGEHWEKVKDKIIFGSWVDNDDIEDSELRIWVKENCETADIPDVIWRPKSLSGFESNNGWISLENNEQIIPDEVDKLYFVGTMFESGFQQRGGILSHSGLLSVLEYEKHTHYKKIDKPKPPIY